MQNAVVEIETERLEQDPVYLDQIARALLASCGDRADHVELRRAASRLFGPRARPTDPRMVGTLVGHAATLRAAVGARNGRDVTDGRLELTAVEPLAYPPTYAQLEEDMRAQLIAFCERELMAKCDGPQAFARLLGHYGWPYGERTFYVGPWKAARMRRRRRADED